MLAPATTESGASIFETISRSAVGMELTVVDVDALLFPLFGSVVLVETVALFVIEPVVPGAVAVIVSIGADTIARLALRVHVTTPALGVFGVQVQSVPLKPVYVTPEGSVSATETFSARLGPRFVTVSV